jgi:hypothetical protein
MRSELVEALEDKQVSNALIAQLAALEDDAVAPVGHIKADQTDPILPWRKSALQFTNHLTEIIKKDRPDFYFDAVALLDVYLLHARKRALKSDVSEWGVKTVQALPALCAAAILITIKKDDNATDGDLVVGLAAQASTYASWMHETHVLVEPKDVLREEFKIVRELRWRVNFPSVYTWLATLCKRLTVCSGGNLGTMADWVLQRGVMGAQIMLPQCGAVSDTIYPRRMANGLVGLSLVSAGLLPLQQLRPLTVSPADWDALFIRSRWQDGYQAGVATADDDELMLRTLSTTVGCDMDVLRADTHAVLEFVSQGIVVIHYASV